MRLYGKLLVSALHVCDDKTGWILTFQGAERCQTLHGMLTQQWLCPTALTDFGGCRVLQLALLMDLTAGHLSVLIKVSGPIAAAAHLLHCTLSCTQ